MAAWLDFSKAISRREWLRSSGLGLVGASLSGWLPVLAAEQAGGARRLITLTIDAVEADAIGDEPVWHDGKVVGWITSGGYGHCVGKSIALGYVSAALTNADSGFEVELLGELRPATLAREALYDPEGTRMRG